VLSAGTGGCLGICGVLMALGFGIPALIIWRRKRNTPADPIATL
jgi:ABC-type dipeptide/oligopeptide/nickel transport system permease component